MKLKFVLLYFCLASTSLPAQTTDTTTGAPSAASATAANTGEVSTRSILADMEKLQTAASEATRNIAHMRIDKWKTDTGTKSVSQANADSIQRNLTTALPGLISSVRTSPQDLNAEFKLYRNLDALYDVFGALTESAGAFGPKDEEQVLAEQLQAFDSVRRHLGDVLETLTASAQNELNELRTRVRVQPQVLPSTPTKRVVVDDAEPAKKTVHKKKQHTANPTGSVSGTSTPSPGDSNPAGQAGAASSPKS